MFAPAFFLLTLLLSESLFAEVTKEDTDYTVQRGKSSKDGADEFVLSDSNGNFSGVVDMFMDKGYQIDKPKEEGNVCLVRNIKDTVMDNVCFVRKSISQDELISMNMTGILEHCQDREVFFEEPKKCNELAIDNMEIGSRHRRQFSVFSSYCFHYRQRVSVTCVGTESWCCSQVLFICLQTCTRCVETSVQYITELHYHYD